MVVGTSGSVHIEGKVWPYHKTCLMGLGTVQLFLTDCVHFQSEPNAGLWNTAAGSTLQDSGYNSIELAVPANAPKQQRQVFSTIGAERHYAATRLQAVHRGNVGRRKHHSKREAIEFEAEDLYAHGDYQLDYAHRRSFITAKQVRRCSRLLAAGKSL